MASGLKGNEGTFDISISVGLIAFPQNMEAASSLNNNNVTIIIPIRARADVAV